ncbi:MAG: gamma-glutamylcyclotransferase [Planctomycetes bacterium]|nr:gamma-glutamylcyclotransferase [Planctomycetota bacterium]
MKKYNYYFAYGSNMDRKQMKQRCPDSTFVSTAVLNHYRFIIICRGVASIVQDDKHNLHGILWQISNSDEENLDLYEGVRSKLYNKKDIVVITPNNEKVTALVYIAEDNNIGKPRRIYIEKIIGAALDYKFPEAYVSELKQWKIEEKPL